MRECQRYKTLCEKMKRENNRLVSVIKNVKNRKIKNLQGKLDKLRGFRADVDENALVMEGFKRENLQKLNL